MRVWLARCVESTFRMPKFAGFANYLFGTLYMSTNSSQGLEKQRKENKTLMASTCSNFRPNFWRSSTCANCYRPKREHSTAKKKNNKRKGRSKSTEPFLDTKTFEESSVQPRYHMAKHSKMIGIVKPYAVVEIDEKDEIEASTKSLVSERRHSEPNIAIQQLKTSASLSPLSVVNKAVMDSSSTKTRRSSSVLDNHSLFQVRSESTYTLLTESRVASSLPRSTSNASSLRRHSHVTSCQPPPPPPRRMTTSATTTDPSMRPQSQLAQVHHVPPKIPSPHPLRRNNAGLTRQSPLTRMTLFSRQKATSFSVADNKVRDRIVLRRRNSRGSMKRKQHPPEKPPRTLSTFISLSDQEELLGLYEDSKDDDGELRKSNTGKGKAESKQIVGSVNLNQILEHTKEEWEDPKKLTKPRLDPMRSSPSPPLPPVFSPSPLTNTKITDLLTATLHDIHERETAKLVCKENLWNLSWDDLNMDSQTTVDYRGIQLSIEGTAKGPKENTESELTISRQLPPHFNIQLVRGLLAAPITPSPLHTLTPSPYHLLRDYTDLTTLSTLLTQQRKSLDAPAYIKLVLLSLVQIFSALDHLFRHGCTHRDVGLECIYASKTGTEWLLKLGNFNYALLRPEPVTAMTFIYSFSEIEWLGGVDSHLPPEVMNTPENAQTVNYSLTDSFAAGCSIYEMMGEENPFEKDTDLVNKPYNSEDLPALRFPSPQSIHLQRLAALLVQRDTSKRFGASTAQLLCQAMLWLPQNWLCEQVSEGLVRHQFEYEKAQLVADIAKRETKEIPLSMILKTEFLLNCKIPELMRALSAFSQ